MILKLPYIVFQLLGLFLFVSGFAQNSDGIEKITSSFSGIWISDQDAKYSMEVFNGKLLEHYEGEFTNTMNFKFSYIPCDTDYYN